MFSEQDVERQLKAALSVSPSPDFEARVLQRIEGDRPSHWTHYGWLAAAASIILVAGVFYALNRTSPAVAPPEQVVEQAPPRGEGAAVIGEPPDRRPDVPKNGPEPSRVQAAPALRSAPRSVTLTPPRTGEPEVIVPLNQMAAVRRLVRAVNEGLVEPPAEPPRGPLAPLERLTVDPVVVEPIPVAPFAPGAEAPAAPSIRSRK